MSRRSQNRNQYESTTTGELAAGAFTVTVVSAAGLLTNQDMYLVIEPDVPGQREWIKIESITGNQLNITNPNGRNLEGSDGDLTHPQGSKVRSVPTQQIFEDIFSDAEDDELALTQHETDGGDPHAQAGYVTQGQTDPLYVNVTGDSMNPGAQIKVDTAPLVLDDLSRKGYVDDQDASTLSSANAFSTGLDHDHATPIAVHKALASDHHTKYSDANAVSAMGTVGDGNDLNHVKYDDGDAVDAMGTKTNSNDLNHDRYTDSNAVSAMGATANANTLRHNRFTDANARSAVDNGTYLKLTGGVLSGQLDMGNNRVVNVTHLEFGNHSGLGQVSYSLTFNDSFWRFRSGSVNDILTFNGNSINFDMDGFFASGMSPVIGTTMVHNSGTGQFGPQSSSRRFKKNLKLIDKASIKAALSKLAVYEYQYKDIPDETHMGWMAEDVAEIHPMLATYDKDGEVFGINQLAVLAVLT